HPPPLSLPPSLHSSPDLQTLHSFPTRRSSDLNHQHQRLPRHGPPPHHHRPAHPHLQTRLVPHPQTPLYHAPQRTEITALCPIVTDRKSTRLNSSHLGISYAVFCLKKKKIKKTKPVAERPGYNHYAPHGCQSERVSRDERHDPQLGRLHPWVDRARDARSRDLRRAT